MNELLHTPLSERELEILRLVAQGKSNKEIASELFISANTVRSHLAKIFQKIGVASRTEATIIAIEKGVIDIPEKAIGSNEDKKSKEELNPGQLTSRKGFLATGNPYSVVLLMAIILLLSISVFALLQRNQAVQVNNIEPHWQKLNDPPSIHHKPAIAVLDNLIYVIGGDGQKGTSAQTDLFDPKLNTWEILPDKPIPVSHAKAVVIGEWIYVPGGRLANGRATDVMEVFDRNTIKWIRKANLPKPLDNYGLSVFENKIFLFGGQNKQLVSDAVFVYDPIKDKWFEETLMKSPSKLTMGVVLQNNKFLLFGGSDGKQDFNSVTTYEPFSNSIEHDPWEQVSTLPRDTKPSTAQLAGGFIFLLGNKGMWQFIPQNNEWILQTFQDVPTYTTDETVVSSDGYLFILGGYNSKGEYSTEFFRYQVVYSVVLPSIYK